MASVHKYTQCSNLTQGVSVGLLLMEWSSWDKTGHDISSQTTLLATYILYPHGDRTHEARRLDDGSVCLTLSLKMAGCTADMSLLLLVS